MHAESIKRLNEVAQRLDKLSFDLELGELEELSEVIGEIVDRIQQDYSRLPSIPQVTMPRYLAEIQQIFDRALQDKMYDNSYGIGIRSGAYAAQLRYDLPTDFSKILGGDVV